MDTKEIALPPAGTACGAALLRCAPLPSGKKWELSPGQKQAVTVLDKNLCVSAGAGSGKTTVLVERFLYIVTEKKISPERIAAITYTEKAANNMKEKLVQEFTKRNLMEERRALENAYISTIHAFAARLLRENPVEARIDPYFIVLEPGAAGILMDETLEEILEESASREDVLRLLVRYGEEEIRERLKEIYGQVRSLSGDNDLLGLAKEPDTQEIWKELSAKLEEFIAQEEDGRKLASFQKNWNIARELHAQILGRRETLSWKNLSATQEAGKGFQSRGEQSFGSWTGEGG